MGTRRERAWAGAAYAALKVERRDLGAGKRALETLAAAGAKLCGQLLKRCITASAGQTGVSAGSLSAGSAAGLDAARVCAAVAAILPNCQELHIIMEAAQSGSAIPQVLAAVRVHSPATAAGGEGVDALAAAVGAALRILVAAASDSTDARHSAAGVLDGSMYLQDIKAAVETGSPILRAIAA